jgi:hypothetical protein
VVPPPNGDVAAVPPPKGDAAIIPTPEGDVAVVPTPKGEDRVEQVTEASPAQNPDAAVVAPRKVRTMIVKSDGTLAPREDPTPVAPPSIDTASESVVDPAESGPAMEETGAVPPKAGAEAAAPQPDSTAALPAEPVVAPKATAKAQSTTTPSKMPIAPTRPSDQPVDIVGEVKPDQIASISPAGAAPSSAWSMQIASQPSEASAQSSYHDLSSRYSSVLNGRTAVIVKAEIAGKGTYWRVRVPAQSRNDAVSLCQNYKAAGGNCFVTK